MQLDSREKAEDVSGMGGRRFPIAQMVAAGVVAFLLSLAACVYLASKSEQGAKRPEGADSGPPHAPVNGEESHPNVEKPPASVLPSPRTPGSTRPNILRAGRGNPDRERNPIISPPQAEDATGPGSNVYNALFSSAVPGVTNGVLDGSTVSVRFFIGAADRRNAIPPNERSVNPAIPNEILVTMSCLFCEAERMQKKLIQVNVTDRTSNEAVFAITPRRSLIRNQSAVGTLIFQMTGAGDGILYDNVTVPVTVLQSGQPIATTAPFVKSAASPEETTPSSGRGVDVTISCFENSSHNVTVEFNTADPELLTRLGGEQLLPDMTPRQFDTNLPVETLRRILAQDYASLVATVANDATLEKALTGDSNVIATLQTSNNLLGEPDKAQLLGAFYLIGKDLYRQLFLVNPDLRALSDIVENYERSDGRPLRIRIESQLFVPWQMLHPLTELDERKFWGFRYEIVVDPQGRQADGRYAGSSKYANGPVAFLKYGANEQDSALDQEVGQLGDLQYEFVKAHFADQAIKIETKKAFLEILKQHLADIEMIIAYTHAENGTRLEPVGGDFTAVSLLTGPRLWFTKSEWLTANELDRLPDELLVPTVSMARHPIVLLNGCETAGGGFFAVEHLDFPSIFLGFGARGVIATEAPIWDMFGYFFGESLVRGLKTGQPASAVLLDTRRAWLHDSNNPLGLLYAYYGGVDASLTF